MTARALARVSKLNVGNLRTLTEARLIPATGKPRRSWRTYGPDAVLLAKIAGAFTQLGGAAMDSASLLRHLLVLPPADREAFARKVVLCRYIRGTSRIDWLVEGDHMVLTGADEPLLVPLRDMLDEKTGDPLTIYELQIPVLWKHPRREQS